MKKLECGTKVLIFHDEEDLLYGKYSFGTIVEYFDEKINEGYERWYTVRDDQGESTYYQSWLYGEDFITPEDYRKKLVYKLEHNNNDIAYLLEMNKMFLEQLKTFDENFYMQNSEEKATQRKKI